MLSGARAFGAGGEKSRGELFYIRNENLISSSAGILRREEGKIPYKKRGTFPSRGASAGGICCTEGKEEILLGEKGEESRWTSIASREKGKKKLSRKERMGGHLVQKGGERCLIKDRKRGAGFWEKKRKTDPPPRRAEKMDCARQEVDVVIHRGEKKGKIAKEGGGGGCWLGVRVAVCGGGGGLCGCWGGVCSGLSRLFLFVLDFSPTLGGKGGKKKTFSFTGEKGKRKESARSAKVQKQRFRTYSTGEKLTRHLRPMENLRLEKRREEKRIGRLGCST